VQASLRAEGLAGKKKRKAETGGGFFDFSCIASNVLSSKDVIISEVEIPALPTSNPLPLHQ